MIRTKHYHRYFTFALLVLLPLSFYFCCAIMKNDVDNNSKGNIVQEGRWWLQKKEDGIDDREQASATTTTFLRRRQQQQRHFVAEVEIEDGTTDRRRLTPLVNNKCGCRTCTEEVLDTDADGYSCGSRIDWVTNNIDGYSEEDACNLIGGEEFPSVCGGCHTARCNNYDDDSNNNEQQQQEEEEEELQQRCGNCETCTQSVWNTLVTDGGGTHSCGDRIEWIKQTMMGDNNEVDACRYVTDEFPDTCTCTCDDDDDDDDDDVVVPTSSPTYTPTTMEPTTYVPSQTPTAKLTTELPTKDDDEEVGPSFRCGGCSSCTDDVWDTPVTDAAGTFSCGSRIAYVESEMGYDEFDACRFVTNEFPDTCTCSCNDDDDDDTPSQENNDNNNDDDDDDETEESKLNIRAISLNVYGYRTMPQAADEYANKIKAQNADVVGIQEGVNDWKINTKYPTDYSRANDLLNALGECWDSRYQIFINTCKGNRFVSNERWDLSDGQDATRTGETAIVAKDNKQYKVINVHWEAFSSSVRDNNSVETANEVVNVNNENDDHRIPTISLGDYNSPCTGSQVSSFSSRSGSTLVADGGIDCILIKGNFKKVVGTTFNASPSDHPGVIAEVNLVVLGSYNIDPSPSSSPPNQQHDDVTPKVETMCGCPLCHQVLESNADGSTCKNRIEWVIANRGFSETDACSLVADEYPNICGVCHASHCGSFPPTTVPVYSGTVKVMSYNTEYKGYWDGRLSSFAAKISEIQADAVGLQECQDPYELAAQSGYALLTATGAQNYILYNADRLQQIDSGTMNIPRDDYAQRSLTWGKFRIISGSGTGGTEFWFFNTHLPHRHNEAGDPNTHAKIGRMLLAKRTELGATNSPTIVVGDCNPFASAGASDGSFESNLAAGGIVKIYQATGSTGGYGGLDKIFASKDHWTGNNGADVGTGRSDHPAIAADLSLIG